MQVRTLYEQTREYAFRHQDEAKVLYDAVPETEKRKFESPHEHRWVLSKLAAKIKQRPIGDGPECRDPFPEEVWTLYTITQILDEPDVRNHSEADTSVELWKRRLKGQLLATKAPLRHLYALDGCEAKACQKWRDALEQMRTAISIGEVDLMALLGNRGNGKTLLAVRLMADMVKGNTGPTAKDRAVRYFKAADLFRYMRDVVRKGTSEEEAIEMLANLDLLVIDEAHERGETDFENRTLTGIIDHRYDRMKPTILIANQTKADFGASMGPSIVSRMQETGFVIECDWPSVRQAMWEARRQQPADPDTVK